MHVRRAAICRRREHRREVVTHAARRRTSMFPAALLPFSALVFSRQTDDRARECIPAQELERRLRSCTYCFRDPCVCASTKYGAALQNEDFSTWLKRQDLVRYKPLTLALRPGVWCSQTAMQSKYVEREYENARLEGVNRLLHARVRTRVRRRAPTLGSSRLQWCSVRGAGDPDAATGGATRQQDSDIPARFDGPAVETRRSRFLRSTTQRFGGLPRQL